MSLTIRHRSLGVFNPWAGIHSPGQPSNSARQVLNGIGSTSPGARAARAHLAAAAAGGGAVAWGGARSPGSPKTSPGGMSALSEGSPEVLLMYSDHAAARSPLGARLHAWGEP